eukprot:EG_transcript_5664
MAFRQRLPLLLQKALRQVEIYDVTLRDGMQGLGMALSLPDKIKVAKRLDEMGFDYIEGGYPLSNPKDQEFFQEISKASLSHSKVVAFGMTHRKGITPAEDEGMAALLRSRAPVATVVGKTWDLHVEAVLQCTLQQNLDMIGNTIRYLKQHMEVFYDAEHYFDGFRANPEYALQTLKAALDGGATRLILCDTNGGSLPSDITKAIAALRQALGPDVQLGIHVHNDGGLAVANTLQAVQDGVVQVQGTINGIGERCGNVDLITVVPNLRLKMQYQCLKEDALSKLTTLSRELYDLTNTAPNAGQPYVGFAAFAHKGGMHVHAVSKIPETYEHIDPEVVGNNRRILVSELAGHSNVEALIGKKFRNLDKKGRAALVQQIASLENQGWQFESAQASLELLVYQLLSKKGIKFWDLESYRCVVTRAVKPNRTNTHAIVKLRVGDHHEHNIADGEGPVHAMDQVLRKSLLPHYPVLKDIALTDYQVRIVNPSMATGAKVRVLADFDIRAKDGSVKTVTTVGVHENIFVASCRVIEDVFKYHLLESGVTQPHHQDSPDLAKWASLGHKMEDPRLEVI